jgi:hypothetical protein
MGVNITITKTSGPGAVEVPDDVAQDCADTYALLKDLPSNRAATTDPFADAKAARLWCKQATTWAEQQEPALKFSRRGDIKGNPTVVTFRIYEPKPDEGRGRPKGSKEDAAEK